MKKVILLAMLAVITLGGCGINSVTVDEIGAIKKGDILVWRYAKSTDAGKSWFYGERIDKIEGENVTFTPSAKEGNTKNVSGITEWSDQQDTTTISELKKYATEQGEEKKVIIEIRQP